MVYTIRETEDYFDDIRLLADAVKWAKNKNIQYLIEFIKGLLK